MDRERECRIEAISYSQVQVLVTHLPVSRLQLAYRLLQALVETETTPLSPQTNLMSMSIEARRQILAEQAEQMKSYYEQSADERKAWQAGDVIDEY